MELINRQQPSRPKSRGLASDLTRQKENREAGEGPEYNIGSSIANQGLSQHECADVSRVNVQERVVWTRKREIWIREAQSNRVDDRDVRQLVRRERMVRCLV